MNSRAEETIFEEALALPSEKRAAYLDKACENDPQLRQRVEELLRAHEQAGQFMAEPAAPSLERAVRSLPLTEKVGDKIGHYKLLQQIGEGGCGVVYMAEQEEPIRRRVAFKVIKLGMDTKQVSARFEAERQALALMDHPNIAKVLDAGATDAGRPYFVMELVRGTRITDYCDQNNLSTEQRLALFIQVCQAVQHAHQKGIIHRDIKPSNILVTVNDGVPVPKVIDFGIAKATEQRLTDKTLFTAFEQFIGTPAYMSPEQAEMTSLDIDTRSDIYGLGVLLYELLTGHTPFDANTLLSAGLDEMRRIIREKDPPLPSTRLSALDNAVQTTVARRRQVEPPRLIHQVRGDLDWIVMKCLEKDRTRRYESATGLAEDLKRHLDIEPVLARPPSVGYRLQKAWRRNRVAFTVAAIIVASLVVGISVSTWQAIVASRARRAELRQRLAAQAAQRAEEQARLRADRLLYVADMNLAQQAWDQNNMDQLRQLLAETVGSPNRGFEWYYWQRQAHLALHTLRGHVQAVCAVAVSPDGTRMVTGSEDTTAKMWDADTGHELRTLKGHTSWIRSAAFSPDGRRIVTGGGDQTARVWEAATGRGLLALKGHGAPITSVTFSPDGQRILTGSQDATARIWEAADGRELFTLRGHSPWSAIWSVAFSPDGRRIVTGSGDRVAKVWDAGTGRELLTLAGHSAGIGPVAFSPDGRRIMTGSRDRTAKVWEADSGRELFTLKGHTSWLRSATFSPDGLRIVTGSQDATVKVWEAASGRELRTLVGHSAPVWSVAYSPSGQRIVTGSEDATAKVWEAAGDRERLILEGHTSWIRSAVFSPDGRRIITGSGDRTARIWEAASGRELFQLRGHTAPIWSVACSPDGQHVATSSADQTAKVWDAANGREQLTLKAHSAPLWSVAFSPDNRWIVTGSDDHSAKVWDAASGRERLTLKGHHSWVRSVAFSNDGQRILTCGGDQTARVWEASTGRELLTLKSPGVPLTCATFCPDGRQIVAGGEDAAATVWDATSGRELRTLKGHGAAVWSVGFSSDGRRIVTTSSDQTAKVWESDSGRELLTLRALGAPIWSARFSPDARAIVTASEDGTARVWRAAEVEQVAGWQAEERAAVELFTGLQHQRTAEHQRQWLSRANDEGAIKQWLLLAPIPRATNQSGTHGLEVELIENEGRLRPRVGETTPVGNGELKWQAVRLEDYVIDFNAILGRETEWSVAYAVSYLRCETEQHGLSMLLGSDDEAIIYLNGQQIHKSPFGRDFVPDQDRVPNITIKAGMNALVFKSVHASAFWQGSIRFTDAQGNPVNGIKVTLDPEGKDVL
jgi:eukaryotic-like serine/threonine-protein kinase